MWCLEDLVKITDTQLKSIFAYSNSSAINTYAKPALDRVLKSFNHSNNKYCQDIANEGAGIREYHSGQYSIYLWYLSNEAYKANDIQCADVLYCLNKALHAVDWLYAIELPDFWSVEHPLGSVMGRAKYGDHFFFYQGCTVGGNNNMYPTIEEYVAMFSDSKVLGEAHIGKYVILGANTYIIDEDVPDYSLVFGQSPNLTIKKRSKEEMKGRFKQFWKTV